MEMLRNYYHPDHASTRLSNHASTGLSNHASTRLSNHASTRLSNHASTGLSNLRITDGNGNAIQHLQNLPFGEDWVDERSTTWNSIYTFTGKEKDTETGYHNFGARYYDSGLSIWLSVDPMAEKYPHQTNYVYCSNNPVLIIDPNGKDEYFNEFGVYFRKLK